MGHMCIFRRATEVPRQVFFISVLFSLSLMGCGDSCFIFVSNPSGGTLVVGTTPCSLNNANGTARIRLTSSVRPTAANWPASIQHIFVTFQGIEANRSATADDDSPDWQELAPQLATVPIQLDLLAPNIDSCDSNVLSDVAVPADTYRQVRLRLSSSLAETNEPILQENRCGSFGFNCIVKADGRTRALILNSQMLRVRIPSDRIAGGSFRILPGTAANVTIEFSPSSSLVFPADGDVRLVPVFTVESKSSCESARSDR
jgi:Domain of unknown function (DUF4382)